MTTAFQRNAFQNNAFQIDEEGAVRGRIIRRGKFKVWDKDPWDIPEKEIVEATAAQLESLLEKKDYLKVELKEAVGAELKAERNKLSNALRDLNKEIDRTKKQFARQREDYKRAEAKKIEDKRRMDEIEEAEVRSIVQYLLDHYDDY